MSQLFKEFLHQWNDNRNQRTKLQQAYFIVVLILAVVSGALSLVDVEASRLVVTIGAFIAAVYITNGVVWALLDAFVFPRVGSSHRPTTKKR